MCAVHEQFQFAGDTRALEGCAAWLGTAKGKLHAQSEKMKITPKVACKVVGNFSFSLAVQAHVNTSNPSTNTLLRCLACAIHPNPKYF